MHIQTTEGMLAAELQEEVLSFYQDCERKTTLDPRDRLVIAREGKNIVGVVKLCFEHDHFLLRTMQVAKVMRGQGIGLVLLKEFSNLIEREQIHSVFCLAYKHLESFYSKIGFIVMAETSVPAFLRERAAKALQSDPGLQLIFLRRG